MTNTLQFWHVRIYFDMPICKTCCTHATHDATAERLSSMQLKKATNNWCLTSGATILVCNTGEAVKNMLSGSRLAAQLSQPACPWDNLIHTPTRRK